MATRLPFSHPTTASPVTPTSSADAVAVMTQLYGQRRFADALAIGLKAVRRDKKNATLHNMIGVLQFETGAADAAIVSFARSVRLLPSFADAHYNHGNALRAGGDNVAAADAFRRALRCDPAMIRAHQNLGNLLSATGQSDQAMPHYRAVLDRDPQNVDVLNNYALALEMRGDAAAARHIYEELLAIKPDFAMAHRNLSLVKKYSTDDDQIRQMQALLDGGKLSRPDQCNLHFALGRAWDQIGDPDRAFAHWEAGNKLRSADLRSDRAPTSVSNAILTAFAGFEPAEMAIRAGSATTSPVPVFIVGMPRSGTSLIEQIIASHSDAFGAGECADMELLCKPLLPGPDAPTLDVNKGQLLSIARAYRKMLNGLGTTVTHITDKLPGNYRHLGFAMTALPDARTLWVRRDPVATCWSIYQSYFATTAHAWAYDFEGIAAEYAHQIALMERWQAMFPERILSVDYDALTQDVEPAVRRILQFLGLDWQPQCLEFHKTERDVRTLSASQVRQKLYTGSSEKWRAYEAHLAPLQAALHRHGVPIHP